MSEPLTREKSSDWSYCPACGGGIDTGYECGKCGRDWLEWHQSRDVLRQEIARLTMERDKYKKQSDGYYFEAAMAYEKRNQAEQEMERLRQAVHILKTAWDEAILKLMALRQKVAGLK